MKQHFARLGSAMFGLILIVAVGCSRAKDGFEDIKNDCDLMLILSSIEKPEFSFESNTLNDSAFTQDWAEINKFDTTLLRMLLKFKGDKSPFHICDNDTIKIGFNDLRTSISVGNGLRITNEVRALHMACALYFDDYYFSSTRELYCIFDTSKIVGENGYLRFTAVNNDSILSVAWDFYQEWLEENNNKSMKEIRSTAQWPLAGSNLYWIGQRAGPITYNYPNTLMKRLMFHRSYTDSIWKKLRFLQL